MITKLDAEQAENSFQEETSEPLIHQHKNSDGEEERRHTAAKGMNGWFISTPLLQCSVLIHLEPVQIIHHQLNLLEEDLSLLLAEYSLFGSILTFGAMIGAITVGPIADFIGRKGAMRISSAFCVAGWLAIYFAEGALALDIGRLTTGYGMGAFSYVCCSRKHLTKKQNTISISQDCSSANI